jgi:predicted Ser/Thr protein kinase
MGNRFEVATAIFTDGLYVEKVFTMELTLGFFGSERVLQLAQAFMVISECAAQLRAFYEKLDLQKLSSSPEIVAYRHLFPTPVSADLNITLPKLIFTNRMHRSGFTLLIPTNAEDRRTAVYLATSTTQSLSRFNKSVASASDAQSDVTMHDNTKGSDAVLDRKMTLVVKFTSRYNARAHEILAEKGYAPRLYGCFPVCGGLFMIVMDRVYGYSMSVVANSRKLPKSVYEDVEAAVKLLHDENIVFGDLRSLNVMVVDGKRAMMIDFDWAGEDGKARYMTTISKEVFEPGTAERGGIMLKSHDLTMLERIKADCE